MLNLPTIQSSGRRIVLAAIAGMLVSACGQKGPLFMPNTPAAAGRATLTQTLNPMATPAAAAASAPAAPITPGSTTVAPDPTKTP